MTYPGPVDAITSQLLPLISRSSPISRNHEDMDSSRLTPVQETLLVDIRENPMNKKVIKGRVWICSGISPINMKGKPIVETPAFAPAASADLSTSGMPKCIAQHRQIDYSVL